MLVAPALNVLGWRLNSPKFWFVPGTGDDADARFVHDLQSNVDGRAAAVVETRALGSNIVEGIEFHLGRCRQSGTPIFAITDGRTWHLYPIVTGVRPGNPAAVCDVYSSDPKMIEAMTMLRNPTLTSQSPTQWLPITEYEMRKLSNPAEIMFPDGSISNRLRHVYDLQLFIVDWLLDNGHLKAESCPIATPRGAILVNTGPTDAKGKPFRTHAATRAGLYVNTARVADGQRKAVIDTILAVGLDPTEFKCRPRT